MRLSIIAFALTTCLVAGPSSTQERSGFSLSVPFSANTSDLIAALESKLPHPLHSKGPRREECVPAERACVKIPEFRGFKIYSRTECFDVTPRITCDLTEHVERSGPLRVIPRGSSFTAVQNITASVRAQGRGAIGKNIRQTGRAKAEMTVTVAPKINPDWSVAPGLGLSHRWISPPQIKILNIAPVTFRGEVDPKIRAAFGKIINREAPAAIKAFNLKGRMSTLWRDLQNPIPIELKEAATTLYLHLRPGAVGLTGPNLGAKKISGKVTLSGQALVSDRKDTDLAKTQLPNLTAADASDGVAIQLPVNVSYETLTKAIAIQLPQIVNLEDEYSAELTIHNVKLGEKDGKLSVLIDTELAAPGSFLSSLGLGSFRVSVRVEGKPVLVSPKELELYEPSFEIEEGSGFAKLLNILPEIHKASLLRKLSGLSRYDLSTMITDAEESVNDALNGKLGESLTISGKLRVSVDAISVTQNSLGLSLLADGTVSLAGVF